MTVKDRASLARRLVDQLGWDSVAVEGVVEALAAATSQDDVDDLVQSYMGGDPAAKRLVQQFISANGQVGEAALWVFVLQRNDQRHSQHEVQIQTACLPVQVMAGPAPGSSAGPAGLRGKASCL